jgi:hypothetical protein
VAGPDLRGAGTSSQRASYRKGGSAVDDATAARGSALQCQAAMSSSEMASALAILASASKLPGLRRVSISVR